MKPQGCPDLEPLVASLLADAPRMSFMQLCRLLEMRAPGLPGLGTRDTPEHEPVRFGSWPRVGFPAAEVVAVDFGDVPGEAGSTVPPIVRTTFMGLYGVDAAMPSHLVDDIVLREEGHEVVESFLDRFNHRFVTLLYRAWKKYRYPESFRPGGNDAHSRNLLCLAGFGWGEKPQRVGLPDSRVLALLGLLIQRTRTPEGLAGVIALTAPGVEVRVDEFYTAYASAGAPMPLASHDAVSAAGQPRKGLGGGYVLGKRLAYRSRAARATLRPAGAQQAHDLLPGAWLHRELMAVVQLYIGVKADVVLRMELSTRFVPASSIATVHAGLSPRLGWTTVLPAESERMINIALGVCEAIPAPAPNPYLTPQHV
ncbi:type VI secretion system baseplate subunit TssG [Paraburkholderia silviterrae]|uniref:Type VI secretion system baseplate subunit TssG n=1 Tax=Paraburkholderia silviterrae TaxID=2528715 RepID=A0A4R5M3U4_9BURK|nr:type VI secretion system baseplate subunit TssG [Paraburkholderia silviterrae]TDG20359.1 type VI secretion system baseplate subunit TssG [Paraburkholderia silviterrae]